MFRKSARISIARRGCCSPPPSPPPLILHLATRAPNRRVREDGSREIFFPPNKTECISRNSNEISPLDRARPFYRRSKLSPQGGKKRPQKRPEIPENSPGKSEVHPSLIRHPLPSPLPSLLSHTWRLPVYFQRGLFNSNPRPARLAKSIVGEKKGDNNRPLSSPLPPPPRPSSPCLLLSVHWSSQTFSALDITSAWSKSINQAKEGQTGRKIEFSKTNKRANSSRNFCD